MATTKKDLQKKAETSRKQLTKAINEMLQPLEEDPVTTEELSAWFKEIFNAYLAFYGDMLKLERHETKPKKRKK